MFHRIVAVVTLSVLTLLLSACTSFETTAEVNVDKTVSGSIKVVYNLDTEKLLAYIQDTQGSLPAKMPTEAEELHADMAAEYRPYIKDIAETFLRKAGEERENLQLEFIDKYPTLGFVFSFQNISIQELNELQTIPAEPFEYSRQVTAWFPVSYAWELTESAGVFNIDVALQTNEMYHEQGEVASDSFIELAAPTYQINITYPGEVKEASVIEPGSKKPKEVPFEGNSVSFQGKVPVGDNKVILKSSGSNQVPQAWLKPVIFVVLFTLAFIAVWYVVVKVGPKDNRPYGMAPSTSGILTGPGEKAEEDHFRSIDGEAAFRNKGSAPPKEPQ